MRGKLLIEVLRAALVGEDLAFNEALSKTAEGI